MPYLMASVAASLCGWLVDELIEPWLGMGVGFSLSLAASTVTFCIVLRWLNELRGA